MAKDTALINGVEVWEGTQLLGYLIRFEDEWDVWELIAGKNTMRLVTRAMESEFGETALREAVQRREKLEAGT